MWEFGFRIGRVALLAVRPDTRAYGHLAFETKYAITKAKQEGCLLYLARSPDSVNPAICELVASGVRRVPNFWPVDALINHLARRQKANKRRKTQELVAQRRYLRQPEVQARLEREKLEARKARQDLRARTHAESQRRKRLGLPGDAAIAEQELRLRLSLRRSRLTLTDSLADRLLQSRLARRFPLPWRRWCKNLGRRAKRELDLPPHVDRFGDGEPALLSLWLRPLGEWLRKLRFKAPTLPIERIRILPVDDPLYYQRPLICAPVYAQLPDRLRRRAEGIARDLGIAEDQPVVTAHFRDSGFKQGRDDTENTRLNLQNTSFEHSLPAIRELVGRGYRVVRLGDSSMRPVSEPGVVDLATSPLRQPLMDPYFIARSDFMIGCDSGPAIVAWLLGTPLIYLNASHPAHCWPLGPKDLMVPKYIKVLADGHYQSLEEMCTLEAVEHFRDPAFLQYEELSADDVHQAVLEMLDRLGPPGSYTTSPLQEEVERLCASFLESPGLPDYLKKWACRDGFLGHGTIARFVVERNRQNGWVPLEYPLRATASGV